MNQDPRTLRDERTRKLIEAGWDAFYGGRTRWLRAVVARLRGMVPEAPELLDLTWRLHVLEGDLDMAMEVAAGGCRAYPDDGDLHHAAGWCLLDMDSPADALPYLRRAVSLDPDNADAWYDLALALERLDDGEAMREAFRRVHELDRRRPPPAGGLTTAQFEEIVAAAMDELPEPVRRAMDNVVVLVEDYPDAWILEDAPYDPRLFGLFVGLTYAESRGSGTTPTDGPARIHLFRRNLERQFPHPDDLAAEIRVTLIHEVGHYLGLEEADLAERGWL